MTLRWGVHRRAAMLAAASALAFCCVAAATRACPYCIRDAGFIVRDPGLYKLYVFVSDDTPHRGELARWLAAASGLLLAESNVRAELINIDRQDAHSAMVHFHKLRPDALPAAILVSPRDAAMVVAGLGPGGISEQEVWELVASVVSSPRREELLKHIIRDWCVLIVVKGDDAGENRRAERAAADAARAIVGTVTEMGIEVERPPHVMSVSWRDPRERILLWSLGMSERYIGRTGIAVVFGMGRRLGPLLIGLDFEQAVVLGLLELLGRNCTCTSDPSELLGPVAPLVWGEDRYAQVRDELGFDPNHPAVASTLAGVWTSLGSAALGAGDAMDFGGGYVEFSLEELEGEGDAPIDVESMSGPEFVEIRPSSAEQPAGEPPPAPTPAPAPEPEAQPPAEKSETAAAIPPDIAAPETPADTGADAAAEQPSTEATPTTPSSNPTVAAAARRLVSEAPELERRTNLTLLIFVGVLGVVAGAGGAFLVRWRNRGA